MVAEPTLSNMAAATNGRERRPRVWLRIAAPSAVALDVHDAAPMNAIKRLAMCLCIAAASLALPAAGDETAAPDDAAAAARYAKLMEQAEGSGRHCMIADVSTDQAREALSEFAKAATFVDLDRAKPIQVTLPETYYNPRGRTIAFDELELAIDRRNPANPYISMTRTAEGLLLEPKISIETRDGKILCVRYLSATIPYRSDAPTGK